MKDSDLWNTVYENLNMKYKNLWEYPLSKLDILMETEFYVVRQKQVQDDELYSESV